MAGGFIGRTKSNAHKHINKFFKPLLSLCKACRRTQSFLGQFLGHINYL